MMTKLRYFLFPLVTGCFVWSYEANAALYAPKIHTLRNGLKVVVINNPRAPVVSQWVLYKVGSVEDPYQRAGVAHFLEHMMFRGTKDYPGNSYSATVTKLGGSYNAFTTKTMTVYHANVAKTNLEPLIKLEADRMQNLRLQNQDISIERKIILEERYMRVHNDPHSEMIEYVHWALHPNHNYARPVLGWESNITAITKEDLETFYKTWYSPNNAIVVFAGDITMDEALPLAEKYYGPLSPQSLPPSHFTTAIAPYPPIKKIFKKKSHLVGTPTLYKLYPAPNIIEDAALAKALYVASTWLGSGSITSYLTRHLVETQKKAVSLSIDYSPLDRGPQYLLIQATPRKGVTLEELEQAIDLALHNAAKALSADELEKTKHRMTIGLKSEKDYAFSGQKVISSLIAQDLDIQIIENFEEVISNVKLEDVKKVIHTIFQTDSTSTVYIEPTQSKAAR